MKLNFEIKREDYADFNKFHFIKTRLNRTILTGSISLIVFQLFFNKDKFNLGATIISSLAFIIFYFLYYYIYFNNTKRIPKDDGTILGPREIEFTDDRIICKTTVGDSTINCTAIKSLGKGRNSYYIYVDTNMALIIPKRVFHSHAELENFENLINGKLKNAV